MSLRPRPEPFLLYTCDECGYVSAKHLPDCPTCDSRCQCSECVRLRELLPTSYRTAAECRAWRISAARAAFNGSWPTAGLEEFERQQEGQR